MFYYVYLSKMQGYAGLNKSDKPALEKYKCALVQVDGGCWAIQDSTEASFFKELFGANGGPTAFRGNELQLWGTGKAADPVLGLQDVNMEWAPAESGIALCDRVPNTSYVYRSHTYYWRRPDVAKMSPSKRAEEVRKIMAANGELAAMVQRTLGEALVMNAGVMLVFLLASVTLPSVVVFAGFLLFIGLPALQAPVATANAMAQANLAYQQAIQNATSYEDLEVAAAQNAKWWLLALEFVAAVIGVAQLGATLRGRSMSGAAAEGAIRKAKAKAGEIEQVPERRHRVAPKNEDWRVAYNQRKVEARQFLEEAVTARKNGQSAAFNAKIMNAIEAEFLARQSIVQAQVMRGHALIVEDLGPFFNTNVLAKLKGKPPGVVLAALRNEGVEINLQTALQICTDFAELDAVDTAGHDWSHPEFSKARGWINDGMANPHPFLSEATMKVLEDPGVSAEVKLATFQNDPGMTKMTAKVRKLVGESFDDMHRSVLATKAIRGHGAEDHHSPKNLADWYHKALDVIHSKIMNGRTYQESQELSNIEFRKDDGVIIKARFSVAIYAIKKYRSGGGKYTADQVVNPLELGRKALGINEKQAAGIGLVP